MKSFITLLALTSTLICLNNSHAGELWNGSCDVIFSGKSTLHNFTGTVSTQAFTVAIANFEKGIAAEVSSQVKAKAAKMDTNSAKRDAKMHDVLQVAAFPDIVVDVNKLLLSKTKPLIEGDISRPTVIPFSLTIKGKKQQLIGKVSDWSYSEQLIKCTLSFPVSLKTSDLVVPTVLGFIKVQDEILVKAKLVLKKS